MVWWVLVLFDYLIVKCVIFINMVFGWDWIFVEGDIDWCFVFWGGVLIDDCFYDMIDELCNCILVVDNLEVSMVEDVIWLKDDDIVFGIEVNGEYCVYLCWIMEVWEMVNDIFGGCYFGIFYCILCGVVQVYFIDELLDGVECLVLCIFGLLICFNKVMYDVVIYLVFDMFFGMVVIGLFVEKGIVLKQVSVVIIDWGCWKVVYLEMMVLVEVFVFGWDFDFCNGWDVNGLIFLVGDVDLWLLVYEDVIGVVMVFGMLVVFQCSKVMVVLQGGESIGFEDVCLSFDVGGVCVVGVDGVDFGSYQVFWFVWFQFYLGIVFWLE